MEDDFERFCKISRGKLPEGSKLRRNRASSLRETKLSQCNDQPESSSPTARPRKESEASTVRHRHYHPNKNYHDRRYSLAPIPLAVNVYGLSPLSLKRTSMPRCEDRRTFEYDTRREKAYSHLRERIYENESSCVSPPPITVCSADNPEVVTNIIRVRSFRRTKSGLISQADKDVIEHRHISTRGTSSHTERQSIGDAYEVSNLSELELSPVPSHGKRKNLVSHRDSDYFCAEGDVKLKHQSCLSLRINSNENLDSSQAYLDNARIYRVQVLGACEVGKTSMCTQFLSAEALDDGFDSYDEGNFCRCVTVDIDGRQTRLLCIENADSFNFTTIESADAYLIVYAVDDRASFEAAQMIISKLLNLINTSTAIILAANKTDLVRARVISTEEGKNLASACSCDCFEVSTSLNHKVNELLVGIVTAICRANGHREGENPTLKASLGSLSVPTVVKGRKPSLRDKIPSKASIKSFFTKHFN